MITRAKITGVVPESNGYKWKVNIPILFGKPDSLHEKELFSQYSKNQQIQTNSSDVETLISINNNKNSKQAIVLNPSLRQSIDELKSFETVARVCGIPNSKTHYSIGDTVIVGFENNDIGLPIILGSLLTAELESTNTTKIELNARTLTSEEFVTLPLTKTTFRVTSGDTNIVNLPKELTVLEISDAVRFVSLFNEQLGIAKLAEALKVLDSVSSLLPTPDSKESE